MVVQAPRVAPWAHMTCSFGAQETHKGFSVTRLEFRPAVQGLVSKEYAFNVLAALLVQTEIVLPAAILKIGRGQ